MPGETDLHKLLKKEACRWMHRAGYSAIAAEVRLMPLGIIDAVGCGFVQDFSSGRRRVASQTCFIECKASRADFLRDLSCEGTLGLAMLERRANKTRRRPIKRSWMELKQRVGLGKFAACLLQPMANMHYILAPAGVVKKTDVPPRWGLLSYGDMGISVVVKPIWQESAKCNHVEGAIARTLTASIYRADVRAMACLNRQIAAGQAALAERIKSISIDLPAPEVNV